MTSWFTGARYDKIGVLMKTTRNTSILRNIPTREEATDFISTFPVSCSIQIVHDVGTFTMQKRCMQIQCMEMDSNF